MKQNHIINIAHAYLKQYIDKNDLIVDATMGNGYDTLFLAQHAKHVYAFDIQKVALEHTIDLLEKNDITNVTLFHESHEHIVGLVKEFKGVVFNLGYLPHGDHHITTKTETTIRTLDMILSVLKPQGFVCMVVYPGHPEGMRESEALHAYMVTLPTRSWSIVRTDMPYQPHHPPYVLMLIKR